MQESTPRTWIPIPGPARFGHCAIMDPVRNRLVVFGGDNGATSVGDDVWALSMSGQPAWSELAITGAVPPGRSFHSAIYDPVRDRMIVFGGEVFEPAGSDGSGSYQFTNDTWALSFSTLTWERLTPSGAAPPARYGASATYDAARDRMVVFGGGTISGTLMNDVWALDLSPAPAWSRVDAAGPFEGRVWSTAIFDARRDRVVVFGGYDSTGPLNDTWALSLAAPEWIEIRPTDATRPPPRYEHGAICDPVSDRLLVFSGTDFVPGGIYHSPVNDLWALSFADGRWSRIETPDAPPGRARATATYDPAGHRVVVFGGLVDDYSYDGPRRGDAWAFALDTRTWSPLVPTSRPPEGRAGHAAIYDPNGHRALVYGGYNADSDTFFPDLWQLSLDGAPVWSQLAPAGTAPPGRAGHSMIHDPRGDRVIVFGGERSCGESCSEADDSAWSLSLVGTPTWSLLVTTGVPPPALSGHSAIFDPVRQRMIVFGGTDFVSANNDVWALALSGEPAWSRLATAGATPAARSGHSAIYDPVGDRMLVFGAGPAGNDTWALELGEPTKWVELHPAGPLPPARISHTAVYDGARRRMLVYGGFGAAGEQSDVWELDLASAPPVWSELASTDSPPPARADHVAVYDPLGARMAIHGGSKGRTYDTWMLALADAPTPAQVALVSAGFVAGSVRLDWFSADPAGLIGSVSRRAADTAWRTLATIQTDGSGHARYTDDTVSPGERYAYRLGYTAGGAEVFTVEAWVDVPREAFALDGMRPNPAIDEVAASISLASTAPARLDLLDLSGRVWSARDVGELGPGAHRVRLGSARALPAGIYWLRLTQAGRTIVAKGVVVR